MINKMLKIYQKLLPELNGSINNNCIHDVEAIGRLLYDKYFKDKVLSAVSLQCQGQKCNVNKDTAAAVDDELIKFQQLLDVRTNQEPEIPKTDDDIWIFGYGSLVWKADFPYIDRRRGFICGYQRRFYQHSIDHRGTKMKPGRVVTLIPSGGQQDRVYGTAYRISSLQKADVLQHLDYREINGYERCRLDFHEFPEDIGNSFEVIMYIATKDNESYAGDITDLGCIAEEIFTSVGKSGPNRDYLFNLAKAMRVLFPGENDEHLFELEKVLLERIQKDEAVLLKKALVKEIIDIIKGKDEIKENEKIVDSYIEDCLKSFETLRQNCEKPGWKEELLTKELLGSRHETQNS